MASATEYCWSKYHRWFEEMGQPMLDILEYEDGEWCIIEWLKWPVMPATTQYKIILSGLKNILPTQGFVRKYLKQIDVKQKEFWAREEAKSKAVEEEWERKETHAAELADKATQAVMQNDDLVERIAKKGIGEIDLSAIGKNVPAHHFRKPSPKEGNTCNS